MDNQNPNQTPTATNPIENPTAAQTSPSSSRSFLSKKTMFMTLFILIILTLIFATPFPRYIGEIACGAPCQDKQYCPPCPSEQWILEKPLFWSVILPMLKQNSSGRYIPISISPTPTPDPTTSWKTYKSEKLGWQISYPRDYRITNGGSNCAIPGGSSGDENTFCFFSPGFSPDKQFTDLGFQVRTENNDEPVQSQEAIADCTFLKEADCKQVIVGNNITTKKFLYTYVDQGITDKAERIFLLSPSKEHLITIEFNYRACEKELTSNCLTQEEYNSKSNQILSTFKFTDQSPSPTCRPRPACLDATPRCMLEARDFCPPTPTPNNTEKACTQEAKLCPDGSSVGRTGPNCEFAKCPGNS